MANSTTNTHKRKRISYKLAAIAKPDGEVHHFHTMQSGFKFKSSSPTPKN